MTGINTNSHQTTTINGRGVVNIGHGPAIVEVHEGMLWVVCDQQDIYLTAGRRTQLFPTEFPITISSADWDTPAVFTVEQAADSAPVSVPVSVMAAAVMPR